MILSLSRLKQVSMSTASGLLIIVATAQAGFAANYECLRPVKPEIDETALQQKNDREEAMSTVVGGVAGAALGGLFGSKMDKDDDDDGDKKGAVLGGLLGTAIGNQLGSTVADRRTEFVYTEADLRYRNELTDYYLCESQVELLIAREVLSELRTKIAAQQATAAQQGSNIREMRRLANQLRDEINNQDISLRVVQSNITELQTQLDEEQSSGIDEDNPVLQARVQKLAMLQQNYNSQLGIREDMEDELNAIT